MPWSTEKILRVHAGAKHQVCAVRCVLRHCSIQKKDNESKTAKSEDDRFAAKDDVEKFVSEKAMKEEELATNMKMQNVGIWVAVLYDEGQYVISAVTLDADSRRSLLSCGLRSNRQVEGESQQLQVRDATIVQPTDALV